MRETTNLSLPPQGLSGMFRPPKHSGGQCTICYLLGLADFPSDIGRVAMVTWTLTLTVRSLKNRAFSRIFPLSHSLLACSPSPSPPLPITPSLPIPSPLLIAPPVSLSISLCHYPFSLVFFPNAFIGLYQPRCICPVIESVSPGVDPESEVRCCESVRDEQVPARVSSRFPLSSFLKSGDRSEGGLPYIGLVPFTFSS